MEQKIEQLERDIADIKERNKRVESDKTWERSFIRIGFIMVLMYIFAVVFLHVIRANNVFLNALVPTVGFFLSTQSLPFIKKWWINKNLF
jgi:hypothetical protein